MAFQIKYNGDDDHLLSSFLDGIAHTQSDSPGWFLELELRDGTTVEGNLRSFHGTGPDDPQRGADVLELALAHPVTAEPTGETRTVAVPDVWTVVVP